jgi:hypothetical protein
MLARHLEIMPVGNLGRVAQPCRHEMQGERIGKFRLAADEVLAGVVSLARPTHFGEGVVLAQASALGNLEQLPCSFHVLGNRRLGVMLDGCRPPVVGVGFGNAPQVAFTAQEAALVGVAVENPLRILRVDGDLPLAGVIAEGNPCTSHPA